MNTFFYIALINLNIKIILKIKSYEKLINIRQ
jgi:hypothetical protein